MVEYYREHRVDVSAMRAGGGWNAGVRIRDTSVNVHRQVEVSTTYKVPQTKPTTAR